MKFVISAVDNASQVMGKVSKSTQLMAAAAGAAIVAFGVSSVKAFADAEKSQVKLEQAYKRFPALATVQISALREMNKALQDKTGADADSLAAAQATLAQFKLTGDQIKQLTPLLVDYAQVTGQDVTTAASSLGRAFMGNTRALKAIGIDFKATGDTAKDFQSIYTALEGQVGGAGEAFGQTTAGQLQILQQSFEDLQEEVGEQLVPALKSLVDVAKPILGAFGSLPQPVKSFTVAAGGAAAAVLLLGPRILTMVAHLKTVMPAATSAATGLTAEAAAAGTAGAASSTAATKVGMLAKALGPISLGVTATIAAMEAWQGILDRLGAGADGVNGLAEAVDNSNAAAAEAALNAYKASQAASSWQSALATVVGTGGAGFPIIVQGFRNASDATANLDQQLAQMVSGGNASSAESMLRVLGMTADEARAKFPDYAAALDAAKAPTGDLAGATGDLSSAAKDAEESMANLKDMLDELGGTQMDSEKAFMKVQEAIDRATEAANSNGRSLDMNTEAGRANRSALQGIASDALAAAAAYAANGESADTIKLKTQEARDAFVAVAMQMGLSAAAAETLATQYGLIPRDVSTSVVASGVEAVNASLQTTVSTLNALDGRTVFVTINQRTVRVPEVATGGYIQGFDGGGSVRGAGTETSDSIPAMLSNGEYVIRASSVRRLGVSFLDDLNDNGHIDRRRGFNRGGVTPNQRFLRFEAAVNNAIDQEQELKDLFDERKRSATAMRNRQAGFASISNSFDTGAYAGAQKDVEAARRRLNTAATPQEAAAARDELAAAEKRAADSKPTAGNLIKGLRAKMRALTSFAADLKALVAKKKIPTAILRDIIDAGPEEGGALAKALLSAKTPELDELVKIQGKIDEAAAFIGQTDANLEYNPQIRRQRQVVNRALARAEQRRQEYLAVRTQVTIDGKQVAEALANYKRAQGGRRLGLD